MLIVLFLIQSYLNLLSQLWDPLQAITAVYTINGVACLSAPLGGLLSDTLIGRYWAVIVGMICYILGYSLLTALSINGLYFTGCDLTPHETRNGYSLLWLIGSSPDSCTIPVYVILVLIGMGVGCVRANLTPFGAEQVRAGGDTAVRQFFNSYYWCVNIGSLIGIAVLAYVELNIPGGFFISFLTATTSLCASLVIFCCGRCYYVIHRPGSSVIMNIFRVIGQSRHLFNVLLVKKQ